MGYFALSGLVNSNIMTISLQLNSSGRLTLMGSVQPAEAERVADMNHSTQISGELQYIWMHLWAFKKEFTLIIRSGNFQNANDLVLCYIKPNNSRTFLTVTCFLQTFQRFADQFYFI